MARALMADSAKKLASYIPATSGNLALAQDAARRTAPSPSTFRPTSMSRSPKSSSLPE